MTTSYNQGTNRPQEKVCAGGAAPIIAGLALGVLAMFYPQLYDNLPAGFELQLGLALGGVISFVAAYYRRNKA